MSIKVAGVDIAIPESILKWVHEDNMSFLRDCQLFEQSFFEFLLHMLREAKVIIITIGKKQQQQHFPPQLLRELNSNLDVIFFFFLT